MSLRSVFRLALGLIFFLGCDQANRVVIQSFTPRDLIAQPQDLEIQFSQAVIPEPQVGSRVDPGLIQIQPALEKSCTWHSPQVIRCYLRGYTPETSYQAEISKQLVPRESGKRLKGNRRFQFTLKGLSVRNLSSTFLPRESPPRLAFTLSFNQEVEPGELSRRLKILAPDGATLPYSLRSWRPATELDFDTYLQGYHQFGWKSVTVEIAAGLPNQARNSTLKTPWLRKVPFPAGGHLEIFRFQPVQRGRAYAIQICFSSAVESNVLPKFLQLDPEVEYRAEQEESCSDLIGQFLPGVTYTVTIKSGLTSSLDQYLEKEMSQKVKIPDLQPTLSLIGEGHYLPRQGAMNLGLETINREQVQVRVKKIFANNLVYFLAGGSGCYCGGDYDEEGGYHSAGAEECQLSRNLEMLGQEFLKKEIAIPSAKNQLVTTTIPVEELIGKERQGIYAVGIYPNPESWYSEAMVWLIATDLGIVAHKSGDQVLVMVRSLESLEPVAGAKVTLFSKNNQRLGQKWTDGRGLATFTGLAETFKEFTPFLLVAERGDDFSFLAFHQAGVNTASFEVAGDPYPTGHYEAFLYPERDIYRPEETAHVVYAIRDPNFAVPASFPVTLKVKAPTGNLFAQLKSQPDALASGELAIPFPREALTGAYPLELYGPDDQPIGRTSLRVEEFMPDRIKVELGTAKERYLLGENLEFTVAAHYLFGPPAAGRRVKASCYLEERSVGFPRYPDFDFSNPLKDPMNPLDFSLGERDLDQEGKQKFTCTIPNNLIPRGGGLSATVEATVFEPGGGRAVSGRKFLPVDPSPIYLGIRRDSGEELELKQEAKFSVLAVDPGGQIASGRELLVRFSKLEWYSYLQKVENRYRYVSEVKPVQVKEEKVKSQDHPVSVGFTPVTYGQYSLEVEDPESGARAAVKFYASGWGYAPWAMEHPDRVTLELDQKSYLPGQTAKLLVKAPFSGKLILMVQTDRLLDYAEYELRENTATLTLPVREAYRPNAYLVATLLRSFQSAERFAPLRAVGIAPLRLSSEPKRVEVKITAPEKIRPNTSLEVTVALTGAPAGQVTLAAVDEGILRLTGFVTPDPLGFFYRKRVYPYSVYDLYSMILPEVVPVPPRSPFGGEISMEKLKRELMPLSVKRVKPVSLWSGLIKCDAEGKAQIKFEVPQFNGSLRLMAVAVTPDQMGSAEANVLVRDPITITSSLPRFLAPGDRFLIPVTLLNGTGQRDHFTVAIETQGKVKVEPKNQSAFIEKDREATFRFQAEVVPAVAKEQILIRAGGAGAESVEQTDLAIRPPYPLYFRTGVLSATESAPARLELPGGWVEGTPEFKLSVSSAPMLKYAESLRDLVHYPYGCVEQTTSSAFPLLYFQDVARLAAPDLFLDQLADAFVHAAIARLISMNLGDGAFSFWPGLREHAYPWVSIYAAHFLIEARKAGYEVPEIIEKRTLDYLWNFTNTRKIEQNWERREVAYALYVLALGGRPNRNVMDWMLGDKEKALPALEDLETRMLLAGAYAYQGDRATAERLLPATAKPASGEIENARTFSSPARANALALNVLLDVSPNHSSIPALVTSLVEAANKGGWHNTQAKSFALLALGKYYRGQEKADFHGTLSLAGRALAEFDPSGLTLTNPAWADQKVEISLKGTGTAYIYWEASGVPEKPPERKPEALGLSVGRELLDEDGGPLDLERIPQGSIVIAKIVLRALDRNLENVVMADLLPAGFEIENPRLMTTAPPEWIEGKGGKPQYLDIRDDRMLTFQDLTTGSTFSFYYALRAVTAGTFALPPVKAEAMYDPSFRSISDLGQVTVVERP